MNRVLALAVGGALAALTLSSTAHATNGYFSHGYGTNNKAMAGAGVALPQDAMAAATNPAGMVYVGDRMDLGAAAFMPKRSYTVTNDMNGGPFGSTSGEAEESGSEFFLIPHFARNWMLDETSSVGISVFGNGGMNTDYANFDLGGPGPFGTFGGGATGINLSQLFIAPTYSKVVSEGVSVGVAAILAYQMFEATGLGAFAGVSSDDTKLTDNGVDSSYGMGARFGIQAEVSPTVTVGAAFQTRTYMTEFDEYAGLFAEQGDFDIPSNWTVGVAWETSERSTLAFDVQHINYSTVAAIANPGFRVWDGTDPKLGTDDGMGFGWQDINVYKLGYRLEAGDGMTWRFGISHADQPIPENEVLFNVLAPGVVQDHITAGFTRQLRSGLELNVSGMYALNNKVSGFGMVGQPLDIEMSQIEVEASLSWTY